MSSSKTALQLRFDKKVFQQLNSNLVSTIYTPPDFGLRQLNYMGYSAVRVKKKKNKNRNGLAYTVFGSRSNQFDTQRKVGKDVTRNDFFFTKRRG